MSSDVVYNCAICSTTVNGKQHYAICISCSRQVHRKCYYDGLSSIQWTIIRRTFTCTACEAVNRGQQFNSSYCSDGERHLVIEGKTQHASACPPTTSKYEIMIGASRKGGDIVNDGCRHAYSLQKDYPTLRVWKCTHAVKFPRCNVTLKQIKRAGIDFLRNYSQEDFTLNAEKEHNHLPNYGIDKQQLTVGQSCSTTNGPHAF
jgi:hypothetical protein